MPGCSGRGVSNIHLQLHTYTAARHVNRSEFSAELFLNFFKNSLKGAHIST